jgi:hypothetical protein
LNLIDHLKNKLLFFKMSSLDAFNELYSDFITDLEGAFPDDESVQSFKAEFISSREGSVRAPLESFMKLDAKGITTRDPAFIKQFAFGPVWDDASDHTKQAIWNHLNGMYMIGMTLSMFPPETLGAIEAAAKKCAESGAFDPSALSGLLAGMMGGGGFPTSRPQPQRRVASGSRQKKSKK